MKVNWRDLTWWSFLMATAHGAGLMIVPSLLAIVGNGAATNVTATLLDRSNPGAIEARRAEAGKLYSVTEFAAEVAKMVTADVESGHTEYVGGSDYFDKSSN